MRTKRRSPLRWLLPVVLIAAVLAAAAAIMEYKQAVENGLGRFEGASISEEERLLRTEIIETAQSWLGAREADGSHEPIIDIYNACPPLARGYPVQYTDAWCATFGSTVAIQCGLNGLIPTECGCEPQIDLFREMDAWVEDDDYVPTPGDYIFYDWDDSGFGECQGRSDHVGIVVNVAAGFIVVIEGNMNDSVGYHWVPINGKDIRGFGVPDYAAAL